MIRYASDMALEKMGSCVLIYVYNRILENVVDDVLMINEVIVANYNALSKRISSSSLDVYMHFQSGDQVFRNIKKYFELTQRTNHRWMDVVKAAIELDISLCIEENLLSTIETQLDPQDTIFKYLNKNSKYAKDLQTLGSEFPTQHFPTVVQVENTNHEKISVERQISILNPESIFQEFEHGKLHILDESQIKNATSSALSVDSNGPVQISKLFQRSNSFSESLANPTHSETQTPFLFTQPQLVSTETNVNICRSKSSSSEYFDDSVEAAPVDLILFLESPEPLFMQDNAFSVNINFSQQFLAPNQIDETFCVANCDTVDLLQNNINFSTSVSEPINKIDTGNDIPTQPTDEIDICNCQSCIDFNEDVDPDPVFADTNIQHLWNNLKYESVEDLDLIEANTMMESFKSFIPELEDINHFSRCLNLTSNAFFVLHNYLRTSDGFYNFSSDSPFSFSQNYFNQSELVQFRSNEAIQPISEFPKIDTNISVCSSTQFGQLKFQCFARLNPDDIGYMSCFRSFTAETQIEILKNRNHLPCSKELRLFLPPIEYSEKQQSLSLSMQTIQTENGFSKKLKGLMSSENKALQSKYFTISPMRKESYKKRNKLFNYKGNLTLEISIKIMYMFFNYIRDASIKDTVVEYCTQTYNCGLASHSVIPVKKTTLLMQKEPVSIFENGNKNFGDTLLDLQTPFPNMYSNKDKNMFCQDFNQDVIPYQASTRIVDEMRCLNLIVYFLEELFNMWAEDMIFISDVRKILQRLFNQLKLILVSVSTKKDEEILSAICKNCFDDIDAAMILVLDPFDIIWFLRSILHKINRLGKYLFICHIIPKSVKYSLFKVYLRHKKHSEDIPRRQRCHTTMLEISAKPDIFTEFFDNKSCDRRIKYIENKSRCFIVPQPFDDEFPNRRVIKIYHTSNSKKCNLSSIYDMIANALNKEENKIMMTSLDSDSMKCEIPEDPRNNFGNLTWDYFKMI